MTVEEELQNPGAAARSGLFEFRAPAPHSFTDFIRDRHEKRAHRQQEQPTYAVPVDNDVRRTLGLVPFGRNIEEILEKMIQVQIGPTLHSAVRVSPRQFPEVYRVVDRCANTLGIAVPRLMIVPDLRIHAVTIGTEENHFIMVSAAMVEKCSEAELTFLIGHECGHIHCRHLSYQALARVLVEWTTSLVPMASQLLRYSLPSLLQFPTASWQRKAELTCDRAGLICSQDLQASLRALAKHVVQSPSLAARLDLDEYLRQLEAASEESTLSKIPEYFAAFPFVPKRMAALRLFSRSELYYDAVHAPKPEEGVLSREELEKATDRVTSVLS